jgi:hypothetical protein
VALGRKIRGATDIGEIGNAKAVYRDGVVAMEVDTGGYWVGVGWRAEQKNRLLPRYEAAMSLTSPSSYQHSYRHELYLPMYCTPEQSRDDKLAVRRETPTSSEHPCQLLHLPQQGCGFLSP